MQVVVDLIKFDAVMDMLCNDCGLAPWHDINEVEKLYEHCSELGRTEADKARNGRILCLKNTASNAAILHVMVESHEVGNVIRALDSIGCGNKFGQVSVVSLDVSRPAISVPAAQPNGTGKKHDNMFFLQGATKRMCVEEIYNSVCEGAEISFGSFANLTCAAIIAGVGLGTNSAVSVVASMLISPMMGPILGFTLGSHIKDWALVRHSLFNEAFMILIAWVVRRCPFACRRRSSSRMLFTACGCVLLALASLVYSSASSSIRLTNTSSGLLQRWQAAATPQASFPPSLLRWRQGSWLRWASQQAV